VNDSKPSFRPEKGNVFPRNCHLCRGIPIDDVYELIGLSVEHAQLLERLVGRIGRRCLHEDVRYSIVVG
jgi:hypothetical protein